MLSGLRAKLRRRPAPAAPPGAAEAGVPDAVSEVFDSEYYLRRNSDVRVSGEDPLAHYLDGGWKQERRPNRWFDPASYLRDNPDVRAAGMEPLEHYLQFGRAEGRPLRQWQSTDREPTVNTAHLTATFPDGAELSMSTLQELSADRRLYCIFLTARSGSTWLTELAKQADLGTPQEWLNRGWIAQERPALGALPPQALGVRRMNDYAREIAHRFSGSSGAMGIELSWEDALCVAAVSRPAFNVDALSATFYLRRRNLVAQAVSLYRSVASGLFHSYESTPDLRAAYEAVPYDESGIAKYLRHVAQHEHAFENLFHTCGFQPVRLYYEGLDADPVGVLTTMACALGTAYEAGAERPGEVRRLRDHRSEDWERRFRGARADLVHDIDSTRPALL